MALWGCCFPPWCCFPSRVVLLSPSFLGGGAFSTSPLSGGVAWPLPSFPKRQQPRPKGKRGKKALPQKQHHSKKGEGGTTKKERKTAALPRRRGELCLSSHQVGRAAWPPPPCGGAVVPPLNYTHLNEIQAKLSEGKGQGQGKGEKAKGS